MDYVKKCEDASCQKEFTTQRADSRFCSDACRKRTKRTDKSDKIKSDKPIVSEIKLSEIKSDTYTKEDFGKTVLTEFGETKIVEFMDGHFGPYLSPNEFPEPTKVDIGYGPNDYTREMVEERIKAGDKFIPNWYKLDFKSKNHFKNIAWKNI